MKFEDIIISIIENEFILSDAAEDNLGKITTGSISKFKDTPLSMLHFEGDKNLLHYLAAASERTQKAIMRVIDPLQIAIMLQQKAKANITRLDIPCPDLLTPAMIAEHCRENGFYKFMQMAIQYGCFFIFVEYFNNHLSEIYNDQLNTNIEFKEFIWLLHRCIESVPSEFKIDSLFDIKQISTYELFPYQCLRNFLFHQDAKNLHLQACRFLVHMRREAKKVDRKFYNKEDYANAFSLLKDHKPELKFLDGLIAKLFFGVTTKPEDDLATPETAKPLPPLTLVKAVSNSPWLSKTLTIDTTYNQEAHRNLTPPQSAGPS